MSEMDKIIRENKGLHLQHEDFPPWAPLEHSSLSQHSAET